MEYGKAQKLISRREIKKGRRRLKKEKEGEMLDKKEVALEFATEQGLARCLQLLAEERPDTFYALPGRKSVILYEEDVGWFKETLLKEKQHFSEVSVVSASKIGGQKLAELRAQRGKPVVKEYADPEWKKKRIEELRKELGR